MEEFSLILGKLEKQTKYIYYHLMGEPLTHPLLPDFIRLAGERGYKSIITTNGTLLDKNRDILLNSPALHKISISLHSFEANADNGGFVEYLSSCFSFCRVAAEHGKIAVMRLWNNGGADKLNEDILKLMHEYFGEDAEWKEIRSGYRIREFIYLEWGDKFDWPDEDADVCSMAHSCYGLRDQIGILSDGSVVPCCLDADGAITLGNVFETSLDDILTSPRAVALKRSFETRQITEKLCQRCGYAKMKNYKK
jgi:radical SAM protein with 4Fe4S-binding SPASM domain